MAKIFIDANVVIDFVDKSAHRHKLALEVLEIVEQHHGQPYISPTTFAICYFIYGKKFSNKEVFHRKMKQVFEGIIYTEENGTMVKKVMNSNFKDLEDGLQYFSCEGGKIDLIITNNLHDFFPASVPVMNAFDFVQRYYDL